MTTLLAIDPGKTAHGWALFEDGLLKDCGLVRHRDSVALARLLDKELKDKYWVSGFDTLVIEDQEIYRRPGKGNKNPNDMLAVAFSSGCVAQQFSHLPLTRPLPRVWTKGQKKEIRHARLLDPLRSPMSDDELAMVLAFKAPKTLKHNVIDAVALGLYALKRL